VLKPCLVVVGNSRGEFDKIVEFIEETKGLDKIEIVVERGTRSTTVALRSIESPTK
jgi:hypothetical protein